MSSALALVISTRGEELAFMDSSAFHSVGREVDVEPFQRVGGQEVGLLGPLPAPGKRQLPRTLCLVFPICSVEELQPATLLRAIAV